jgi:hypothetical protein
VYLINFFVVGEGSGDRHNSTVVVSGKSVLTKSDDNTGICIIILANIYASSPAAH